MASGYIRAIEEALQQYNAAALKFMNKVESGRARSVETYAELKAAYDNALRVTGKGEEAQ